MIVNKTYVTVTLGWYDSTDLYVHPSITKALTDQTHTTISMSNPLLTRFIAVHASVKKTLSEFHDLYQYVAVFPYSYNSPHFNYKDGPGT